jgi:hypothetical protein
MILATSLSPNHINKSIQQTAIDSWNKLGFKCFSFNHESEIEVVSKYNGISIINTGRTAKHIFNKHYVLISEIIDWFKTSNDNHFCIINSDIILNYDTKLVTQIKQSLSDNVIICHRQDYTKSKKESQTYHLGIDAFFLHKTHLNAYPQSLLCIGQCFWDYHIPFTAIENGISVLNIQNKFAFHKKHEVQYSPKNWETTGKIFAIEHQLDTNDIGRLNTLTFNFLDLNCKKITL